MARLLSLTELAELVGVTPRQASNYVTEGMPVARRQGNKTLVNSKDALAWWRDRGKGQVKTIEEARLRAAQAEKTEMEVARMRGDLLAREEVVDEWNHMLTVVRTRALNIPQRTAPLVAGESDQVTCQAIIDREVRECLEELAERDGSAESDSTAATS